MRNPHVSDALAQAAKPIYERHDPRHSELFAEATFVRGQRIADTPAADALRKVGKVWAELETKRLEYAKDQFTHPGEAVADLVKRSERARAEAKSHITEAWRNVVRESEAVVKAKARLFPKPDNRNFVYNMALVEKYQRMPPDQRDAWFARSLQRGNYELAQALTTMDPELIDLPPAAVEARREQYLRAAAPEVLEQEERVLEMSQCIEAAKGAFDALVNSVVDFPLAQKILASRVQPLREPVRFPPATPVHSVEDLPAA